MIGGNEYKSLLSGKETSFCLDSSSNESQNNPFIVNKDGATNRISTTLLPLTQNWKLIYAILGGTHKFSYKLTPQPEDNFLCSFGFWFRVKRKVWICMELVSR